MNSIQQLYSAVISGTAPFDGIVLDKQDCEQIEFDNKVDEILKKNKIPVDEINNISSALCDYSSHSEYCGFRDGFKLGVRLAAEVFDNE